MAAELRSLKEAAQDLGVSRRRVDALIRQGQLPADRIGSQLVVSVDALRSFAHNWWREGGQPLSQRSAWKSIWSIESGVVHPPAKALDRLRRRLRARARHVQFYAHPSLLARLREDSRVVVGGQAAAVDVGVPAALGDSLDAYLKSSDLAHVTTEYVLRDASDAANLRLHVVDDDAWPFDSAARTVGPWVAWLDLADAQSRVANTLLDRLAGRPADA